MTRFEQFLLDELWESYIEARKNKRYTVDEHAFELNAMENILNLHETIMRRVYKPSRGVAFIISDPVTREIVAAPFRDRVIHHFLHRTSAEWWDRRFIADSYACRKGKGTLYGQERLQKHLRQAIHESASGKAFIAKLDLQGYFMSLERKRLYERVLWGLERQFNLAMRPNVSCDLRCHPLDRMELYATVKYLWKEIIHDRPMEGIRIKGQRSDWRKLPSSKTLFGQVDGRGIVIGNLTSQLLSNIYMDQFDRFVKFDLGYKHYGRYVDDFFVIVPVELKEKLLNDVHVMEKYLSDELALTLHPQKRSFQDADKGITFIGAVVYPNCKIPSQRSRRNYKKLAYQLATTGEGEFEGLVQREGTMRHLNAWNFIGRTFVELGWEWEW